MKRRTLGPAYERAPAERMGEWAQRNILALCSAVILIVIYLFLFNFIVDDLLQFLATGGDQGADMEFYSDHPVCIAIKIVGSLLIGFIIVKTRTK